MIGGFKGAINTMVRALVFLGLTALAQAQGCSNATYSGTYFYVVTGTTSASGSTVPYAQLGKLTADGNGNLSGSYWQNTNGVITQVPVTET
jgi:hypothetical protein